MDGVKEETSEPPKAASESPTEPQQHPELTGTFAAPTGTSSSRQQQLHDGENQFGYILCKETSWKDEQNLADG